MTSFTKKSVALVITIVSLLTAVFAQNYDEVFTNGQKLWNAAAYKEACTEFKRYIYLQELQTSSAVSNEKLSQCYGFLSSYYEQCGELQRAIDYIQIKQNLVNSEQDILQEIKLYSLKAQTEKYNLNSEVKLWCYKTLPEYSNKVHVAAYRALLVSYMECDLWDLFVEEYNQLNAEFPDAFTEEEKEVIDQSLLKIEKFRPKNPVVAKWLSIIPGLGQTYAGDPLDGLNAFVLNGSLIGLSVYSLCTGGYADFVLLELNPTYRFYKGNFYNAGKDSDEYNSRKMEKLKAPVKKILLG